MHVGPNGATTPPRILVVDDEKPICDLLAEILSAEGLDVTTETNGLTAIELLKQNPFDLIVTDLSLGVTDGMHVLEQALIFHPDVAVILITGYPTLETAVQALKAGAYDYVTKPFTVDSIRAVVRRAIENIRLKRENSLLREAVNLKQITDALISTLELKEVLQVVLRSALDEVKADYGAVLLDSKHRRRVSLAAFLGSHRNGDEPDLSVLYQPEQHEAWRTGARTPVLVASGEQPDFPCPLAARESRRSFMHVPLHTKGEFIGVLHVCREKSPDPFNDTNLQTLQMIASQATFAIENASLYDTLHGDYLAIIRSLANAVEAKDPYTRGHGDRVVKYTGVIGQKLGYDKDMLEKLKVAAILHDIGKIGIRDQVLLKPGKLTDTEYQEMKLHPIIGDRILAPIQSLEDIRLWVYQHHERMDGKGYPEGIGGSDLAEPSRALIVAEVFDALVTERAYKPAWPLPKVMSFLQENADTHFDRQMVEIMVEVLQDSGEALYRENVVVY